jgi:hypothetical protein
MSLLDVQNSGLPITLLFIGAAVCLVLALFNKN